MTFSNVWAGWHVHKMQMETEVCLFSVIFLGTFWNEKHFNEIYINIPCEQRFLRDCWESCRQRALFCMQYDALCWLWSTKWEYEKFFPSLQPQDMHHRYKFSNISNLTTFIIHGYDRHSSHQHPRMRSLKLFFTSEKEKHEFQIVCYKHE